MAVREIRKIGDDILRKVSREVTDFNKRLHELIDDMRETLKHANGAGLAAPQVGILRRVAVVSVDDQTVELINPVIVRADGKECCMEGCLSIPGKSAEVERPARIKVKAHDRYGNAFEMKCSGWMARAVCHEVDHLNGILYVDIAKTPPDSDTMDAPRRN